MSFEKILARISAGESVAQSELLPYLMLERRKRRAEVNRLLAEAYWQSGREDYREFARVSVRRAWLLGGFPVDLLPLYTEIHGALGDVTGVREAYKRAGIMAAERGNVSQAIDYFNRWQYASYQFARLDKYEFDFDILNCIERAAKPNRIFTKTQARYALNRKLRIAYLVKGITELGAVLVELVLLYARHHDRSRFEPIFFVPESESEVMASEVARQNVKLFANLGYKLVTAPDLYPLEEQLIGLARAIHDARCDVLVALGALAQFEHYFITALRPTPFMTGWIVGPPPQFAAPTLDWGIAWSIHPLIDCPIDCFLMAMELEFPKRDDIETHTRQELDIPENATIAATAGRHVKFQEPAFWKSIIELLEEHPNLYYLAMGLEEPQVPFVTPMLSAEIRSRIRFIKWSGEDYLRNLCLADLFIDTHPSGGGAVTQVAISLGIPAILFEQDFLRLFDQVHWSPVEELFVFDQREIVVPRGDYAAMKRLASRMIVDPEYRRRVAGEYGAYLRRTRGDPVRAVRQFEESLTRVLKETAEGSASRDEREAEIMELVGRRNVPPWIRRSARWLKRAMRYGERVLDRVA